MANDPKLQPATHPGKYRTREDFVPDLCGGKVCAEIGVAKGSFSATILAAKPKELHLIDPWIHQPQEIYPGDQANRPNLENIVTYQHVIKTYANQPGVVIKKEFSFDAAQTYPENYFDFIFIDAIHTKEMVLVDICSWWPRLKKGGIMAFHDANLGEMGIPGTESHCPALSVYAALQHFLKVLKRQKLDIMTYEQDSAAIIK